MIGIFREKFVKKRKDRMRNEKLFNAPQNYSNQLILLRIRNCKQLDVA